MSDRRLALLGVARPIWFEIRSLGSEQIVGRARVEETIWRSSGIALKISADDGLLVGEETPGTLLPKRCAERHIQSDNTFCLGVRPIEVTDISDASGWWEALRQYLWLQSVAKQTGVWPDKHYLDHGGAGLFHEQALELAAELGIQNEYSVAYDGEASWITDSSLRLADKDGRPINGRAACPRDCKHSRGSAPKLRRDCSKREGFARLTFLERKRRLELAKYWQSEVLAGAKCCGTMRNCPLRSNNRRQELAMD